MCWVFRVRRWEALTKEATHFRKRDMQQSLRLQGEAFDTGALEAFDLKKNEFVTSLGSSQAMVQMLQRMGKEWVVRKANTLGLAKNSWVMAAEQSSCSRCSSLQVGRPPSKYSN